MVFTEDPGLVARAIFSVVYSPCCCIKLGDPRARIIQVDRSTEADFAFGVSTGPRHLLTLRNLPDACPVLVTEASCFFTFSHHTK